MKRLVCLLVALTPALASADKHFDTGKGATWDCAKDPVVHINIGKGNYTFTGACREIHVNSGSNTVAIETVKALHVNGGKNTLTIADASGSEIHVNGASNKVHWDKGSPKVHTSGTGNDVGASAPQPK